MKKPAERMREELNATGCYALTGETPGDWDLLAMEASLADFDTELEQLVQDVLLQECDDELLTQWERCIRPQRSQENTKRRKEILQARLSVHPSGSSLYACNALLPAAGAAGFVTESENGITVQLAGTYGLTDTEVQRELSQLMPAHLPLQIVSAFTWQTIDLSNLTFQDWEKLSLTWEGLENLTREELKGA